MERTLRARRLSWAWLARPPAPLTAPVSAAQREKIKRARLARLLAPLTAQWPAAVPRQALGQTERTEMAPGLAPPMA